MPLSRIAGPCKWGTLDYNDDAPHFHVTRCLRQGANHTVLCSFLVVSFRLGVGLNLMDSPQTDVYTSLSGPRLFI